MGNLARLGWSGTLLFTLVIWGFFASPSAAITSDDFSSAALDTVLWRFFDPVGDVSVSTTGTNLLIDLPGGTSHDLWRKNNKAPRLVQSAADQDFGIEAKFDSDPSERFQIQGLVVQETDDRLIRFDVYHTGTNAYAFAAYIDGDASASVKINKAITGVPSYLRVTRTGSSWHYEYSFDGINWTNAGTFTQALVVAEAGVFVGNHGYSAAAIPAFTGDVDYFFNTDSPIIPEDGGGDPLNVLTTTVAGNGSIVRLPNQAAYASGTAVELTALGDPGWDFAGWVEGLSGIENPSTLTILSDTSVTASFTPVPYTLTTATSGGGNVSVAPDQASYTYGDQVVLTAVPDNGMVFVGWSGDVTGGENPKTITIAGNTSVTASFGAADYTLDVVVAGNGTVTKNPDQANYSAGQPVTLTAVPDNGQMFLAWSGDVTGSENPKTFTITGNTTVTATFGPATYTLDVLVNGSGTVSKNPDQPTYLAGEQVVLTAVPSPSYTFAGWSGALSGTNNPETLTIAGDETVTATFSPVVASGIVSDDFNAGTLDTGVWRFLDPVGDVQFVMTGTNLLIDIPGGISHDLWSDNNKAPRFLQSTADTDFEVETKFDSAVEERYQMQGFLAAQDDDTYLRFDVFHDGTSTSLLAAFIDGPSSAISRLSVPVAGVPSYLKVARVGNQWTYRYSFDGTVWQVAGNFTQIMTVTETGFFAAAHVKTAFTGNVDYFFDTASPVVPEDSGQPTAATPPMVEVWYGDNQNFGHLGNPQPIIQVVGRVWDTDALASLSYKLNGGASQALTIGPDGFRLVRRGEYNIEIDNTSLNAGANTVEITAMDTAGEQTVKVVTVNYTEGVVWSMPETLQWQGATSVTDVAQVVDGLWYLEGDEVRTHPSATGYDRLLVAGEYTWPPNYEVVLPFTAHNVDPDGAVGVAVGWPGHTGPDQPRVGHPYQSIGWVTWDGRLQMLRNGDAMQAEKPVTFNMETRYLMKVRSETLAGGLSDFRVKWWQEGSPEPAGWDLSDTFTTMNGSVLLIAHRADVTFGAVSITPVTGAPQHVLTTHVVGGGSVVRNPNQTVYADGTDVQLTAVPDAGWTFTGWSGGLSGQTNPDIVTMSGDVTVTATFAQVPYTLTLDTVGGGSVTANPDQATYLYGDDVVLTAVPNGGETFLGWSGDLGGSANPDTITITGNASVTATFGAAGYTLDVTVSGNGSVTKNPDQATYSDGQQVTLTAVPSPNSTFVGWSGDLGGSTNPETITMTGNTSVTATFAPIVASGIVSDDFSAAALDTTLWRFYDPVGDVNLTVTGTNLLFDIPAGISHDLWRKNNKAPRVVQAAPDQDFGIEAKFDSQTSERFQMQGLVVQESDDRLIRFDVYSTGTKTYVFAAYIDGNVSASVKVNTKLSGVPSYLRVTRTGSSWHYQYSFDGSNWTDAGTFTQALAVSEVGVFAANHGYSAGAIPAFTGDVDYFFNTDSPIVPEDGPPAVLEPPAVVAGDDTPRISELSVSQNYPNPFAQNTRIDIGLPEAGEVKIQIYDVRGRRVFAQNLSEQSRGWNQFSFDGYDATGKRLATGVYFYRVTTPQGTVTKKMVLAR